MPTTVHIEGQDADIEFPDSMSTDEIQSVIRRKFGRQNTSTASSAAPAQEQPVISIPDDQEATPPAAAITNMPPAGPTEAPISDGDRLNVVRNWVQSHPNLSIIDDAHLQVTSPETFTQFMLNKVVPALGTSAFDELIKVLPDVDMTQAVKRFGAQPQKESVEKVMETPIPGAKTLAELGTLGPERELLNRTAVGRGIVQGIEGTTASLATPKNLAIAPLAGEGAVGKALATGFAAQMLTQEPALVSNVVDAARRGDKQETAKATTEAIVNGIMAVLAGAHGARGGPKVEPKSGLELQADKIEPVAPATAAALREQVSGSSLQTPKGAMPPDTRLVPLIEEGVRREDAEALIAGTKTPKEVVDSNFFKITPKGNVVPGGVGDVGHLEAFEQGRNQAIDRISNILQPTEKGAENASSITSPAEVHGNLQPQPVESAGEMPAEESSGGVQSEAEIRQEAERLRAGEAERGNGANAENANANEAVAPAAPESKQPQSVKEAWNAYDDTGEIDTVRDLADHIERLVGEGKAPKSLARAVDRFRKAVDEDFSQYAGRGDLEAEEERFTAAVEKAASKPERKPKLSKGELPESKPATPGTEAQVGPATSETAAVEPTPAAAPAETGVIPSLFVKQGNRMVQVTPEQASAAMGKIRSTGAGASEIGRIKLYNSDGKQVGFVSPNGNAWLGSETGPHQALELIHNATGLVRTADNGWDIPTPKNWSELTSVQDQLDKFRAQHKNAISDASLAAKYPEFAKLIVRRDQMLEQLHPPAAGQTVDVEAERVPESEPAPKVVEQEKAPPVPMNMAGEVRQPKPKAPPPPEFSAIHPRAQEKFNAAWDAHDIKAMSELLDPMNKGMRAEFERRMGVKLPKTISGTRKTVETYFNALESSRIAEKSETPAAAYDKVEEQVQTVAKTEGQRTAKEVKSELIDRLEKAIEDIKKNPTAKRPDVLEVDIPGDGKFKVPNLIGKLEETLAKVKRIPTNAGSGTPSVGSKAIGNLSEQATKAIDAYGGAENAYKSVRRQIQQLRDQGIPETAEDRQEWNRKIEGAQKLQDELYQSTKAAGLEGQAERARDAVKTYKEGAKSFEESIAKLEEKKKLNGPQKARLKDLKERYAQNQKFIRENEANADKWEQEAAKEKAKLDAETPKPETENVERLQPDAQKAVETSAEEANAERAVKIANLKQELAKHQKKLDKNVAQMGNMRPPSITAELTRTIANKMAKIQDQIDELEKQQPEGYKIVGMGGAIPEEFGGGRPTSNKNATVDAERAKRGLPPMMSALKRDWGTAWDEAMARIYVDPEYQDKLIHELQTHPRPVTDTENVALLHRRVDLRNEMEKAMRDAANEYDSAKSAPDEETRLHWQGQMETSKLNIARASDALAALDKVTKAVGTELGRGLNARKQMMEDDHSLAAMEQQMRAARDFRPLTDEERAELVETQKKLAEADKRAVEAEARANKEASEKAAAQALADALKEQAAKQTPFDKRVLEKAGKIVEGWKAAHDEALISMRKRLGMMTSGVDPTIIADLAKIGRYKIGKLALDKAGFVTEMVRDLGEKVKPYLDDAWEAANKLIDESLAKVPEPIKRAVKKMDVKERVADAKERIAAAVKKGELDAVQPLVQKLVRGIVEMTPGITRDQLVDAVHEILKEHIPDITRREAMDAISGYGRFTPLRKDTVSLQVRDLKGQLQQVAKLEDLQSRKPLQKSGLERREPSDEERRLIKQVNEAKRRYGVTVTNPETQLKSALNARKTAMRNQIADLEYEIAKRERIVKTKTPPPSDAELEQLRAQRDKLKAEHEQIFPKEPMSDAKKAELAAKAIDRQIAEVQRQIKEGDIFAPGKKKPLSSPELDAKRQELKALQAEREWLRESIQPTEYKTAEERYNSAYKARLQREIADKTARMARGDFSIKPRPTPPALTPEVTRLKAQAAQLRKQWQQKLIDERLKNRSKGQKVLDTLLRIRREFTISGLSALLLKLPGYSVMKFAEAPIREAVGRGLAKLPGVRDIAEKAPSEIGRAELGPETRAMADDYRKAFTRGIKDAKDSWAGESELKNLYDERPRLEGEFRTFFGRLHQMEKSPLIRFKYEQSLRRRLDYAAANDENITDPGVLQKHGALAYADALNEALVNKNEFVKRVDRFVNSLAEKSKVTGRERPLGKAAQFVYGAENPVKHVPANFIARTSDYAFGLVRGGIEVRSAFKRGIETLQPEEANQIMRHLTSGAIGNAAILLGFLAPQMFGGLWYPNRKDDKLKPGEIKTPVGTVPSAATHNPLLNAAQFGATLRQVSETKLRKGDKDKAGLSAGAQAAFYGLMDETPYLKEIMDFEKALDPRTSGSYLGQKLRGYAVPSAVQQTAQYLDTNARGEPVKRNPKGPVQNIQVGLPVLRQRVPKKK